jgi:hypothetical protein
MFIKKLGAAAVAAFLLCGPVPAFASECDAAIDRYDAAVEADTAWYQKQVEATFGKGFDTDKLDEMENCPKYLPIMRGRLPYVQADIDADAAAAKVCPASQKHSGGEGSLPEEIMDDLQSFIAECETYIKENP